MILDSLGEWSHHSFRMDGALNGKTRKKREGRREEGTRGKGEKEINGRAERRCCREGELNS